MADNDLVASAAMNARVFEDALVDYVEKKVAWATEGASSGWLDCTGCLWCLFDDGRFVRRDLPDQVRLEPALPFCLYWSLGDVLMPASATPDWVAARIRDEAVRLLKKAGFTADPETREVDGESHLGVAFRRRFRFLSRFW